MFDGVAGFLVNAVSISSTFYLMNRWFDPKTTNSFLFLLLAMLIWITIDFVVGIPIFLLNKRFNLFHSDWDDGEKKKPRKPTDRRSFGPKFQ